MIAITAGVAAPLTILVAGAAVVLLAFTVAELTRRSSRHASTISIFLAGHR